MPAQEKWTRAEHVLAFNLYCQIPFGTIHINNPRVRSLAKLLGRSVSSVSLKLANFSRLDPALQQRGIRGLPHGAKGEEEVWREFADHPEALVLESEQLLAKQLRKSLEEVAEIETHDLPKEGIEREAIVQLRVNQSFFRRRILSAYDYRCCVTGLTVPSLLVASHIIPWSEDIKNRMNPRNGLCLNALHDRAFDRCMMWVEEDHTIRFAAALHDYAQREDSALEWLLGFEGKLLMLPKIFTPDEKLLRRHAERCRGSEAVLT
jgi:putative restriction endonuclease